MQKDYYKILGVHRSSTDAEIKKAFRLLAFRFHPDKNDGNKDAEEKFKELHEAYEILGNAEKRKLYNLRGNHPSFQSYYEQSQKGIKHYFYVTCDKEVVLLNEEVKITFTYSGDGRVFRKPSFRNFFLTGAPFASFRYVLISGVEVKETSLTYIIAPLKEGTLIIEEAFIKINKESFTTTPCNIIVKENSCYFTNNKKADNKPIKYILNFETEGGTAQRRTIKNTNHTVLIPRSNYAYVYHRIGAGMKIFFFVWGLLLGWKIDVNPLVSGIGGLLFGGIFCNLLYLIAGVRPKFYFAKKYHLIQEYLEKGYRSGTETGSSVLNSEFVYFITSLIG